MDHKIMQRGFDTAPIKMEPFWQIAFQAPTEDVDRIFNEILKFTQLQHGKTDHNAYRNAVGTEYYRPLEGTPTGFEENTRQRPEVHEMRFYVPRDEKLLNQIINSIYDVHSYYEPVITVQEILRSTTNGLNDQNNPHRWWNKGGDWKNKDD